jgi:hypothetical protein
MLARRIVEEVFQTVWRLLMEPTARAALAQ